MENNIFTHRFNTKKYETRAHSAKIQYDMLRESKYTLVFGTSRSHKISSRMMGTPVLNFSGTIYGEPSHVYDFLLNLDKEQLRNITQMYYLLDLHTFCSSPTSYKINLDWQNNFQFIIESLKNFSLEKTKLAVETIYRNMYGGSNYIDIYGSMVVVTQEEIFMPETSKGNILSHYQNQIKLNLDMQTFKILHKIDTFCKKNSIKITYFTPTLNQTNINYGNHEILEKHRKLILANIDNLYDFTVTDGISENNRNFTDIAHMNVSATQKQVEMLLSDEKEKYLATKDNIDARLTNLRKQR